MGEMRKPKRRLEVPKEKPKGFTCLCGAPHFFPAYVYADWDQVWNIKCGKCERLFKVIKGRAQETTERAIRKSQRRAAAVREAENARYWVGQIRSADRMIYRSPVNRAASRMVSRKGR
jgi:hypothetical protein